MLDIKKLRVLYMGTPQMSARLLEHLIISGFNVVGVVAQTDQKIGRKQILTPVPTKVIATKYAIPVFQPEKIKHNYQFVIDLVPDLILCFAYGQIIPEVVLKIPKYGALNFHGSLLPKYRGAAPIQYALINNDIESGVCLMEMVKQMDAGRVYATHKFPIQAEDNYATVAEKVVISSIYLCDHYLQPYLEGKLIGVAQDESGVTFAPSIKSEEERINLTHSIQHIYGLIRALSPSIGAYVIYKGAPLKIFEASIVDDSQRSEVGTFVQADKNGLYLQLVGGILSIKTLQKSGKTIVSFRDFVNGEKDLKSSKVE